MDKRFFLKEVIVDSRKNQKLSGLQVKLQGPMLAPCGGLLQLGWPRPRLLGPQLCARPTRVGLGSALGKTRLKITEPGGRHRFTEMRKPPGHQGRPCGFLQIWANFNISSSRWKKSVVGLECVRRDQRKLSSLNQACVCCPQVFTG